MYNPKTFFALIPGPVSDTSNTSTNLTKKPLFDSSAVVCKLMLDLLVLLTFGLASPLLSVAVIVSSVNIFVLWKIRINRFVFLSGERHRDEAIRMLDEATHDVFSGVVDGLHKVVWVASLFWGIFVFDMVGGVHGDVRIYLLSRQPIVQILGVPLIYWGLTRKWWIRDKINEKTSDFLEIEMTTNPFHVEPDN